MENIGGKSRLDQVIESWNEKEDSLTKKFKDSKLGDKDYVKKEKLKYYEAIKNQFKNPTFEDRLTRNILKGKIGELEKALYPKRYRRYFERFLKRPVERAIEKFIDKRRFVPQSNILKNIDKQSHKSSDSLNISEEGSKQNLKNSAGQEIKQKEQQGQKLNADPFKNSVPDRHTISTKPLRNSNTEGINREPLKLKNENLAKKQLRHKHRLH